MVKKYATKGDYEYLKKLSQDSSIRKENVVTRITDKLIQFISGNEFCIKKMVADGRDLNLIYGNTTLLHEACMVNDNINVVRYLLENGADPNIQIEGGYTPLHVIGVLKFDEESRKVMELLIDKGADLYKEDEKNYAAVDFFKFRGDRNVLKILRKKKVLKKAMRKIVTKDIEEDMDRLMEQRENGIAQGIDIGELSFQSVRVESVNDLSEDDPRYILANILNQKLESTKPLAERINESEEKKIRELLRDVEFEKINEAFKDISKEKRNIVLDNIYINSDKIKRATGDLKKVMITSEEEKILGFAVKGDRYSFKKELDILLGSNIDEKNIDDFLVNIINKAGESIIRDLVDRVGVKRVGSLYGKIFEEKQNNLENVLLTKEDVLEKVKGSLKRKLRERLDIIKKVDEQKKNVLHDMDGNDTKKGADMNKEDEQKKSELMYAIEKSNLKYALKLIEEGDKLDFVDKNKKNALMYAIEKGNTKVALKLIEKGVKLDSVDDYGKNALMYAIKKGNTKVALELIEEGAKLDSVDNYGRNALMHAIRKGNTEVALKLIGGGAKLDFVDSYGRDVLMYALNRGEKMAGIISYLLDVDNRGVNRTDNSGRSLLMCACEGGYAPAVEVLVDNGADVNARDSKGSTAVGIAFLKDIELAKYLIRNKSQGLGPDELEKNKREEFWKLYDEVAKNNNRVVDSNTIPREGSSSNMDRSRQK